jgi:hypothetical protein
MHVINEMKLGVYKNTTPRARLEDQDTLKSPLMPGEGVSGDLH